MATVKNLPVTLQDQGNINQYSYLIYKTNRLTRQLEEFKSTAANQAEALEELDTLELEHDDLDNLRVAVKCGNALFHLPLDMARGEVESAKSAASLQVDALSAVQTKNKGEMADLKKRLESKFGDSIRLE